LDFDWLMSVRYLEIWYYLQTELFTPEQLRLLNRDWLSTNSDYRSNRATTGQTGDRHGKSRSNLEILTGEKPTENAIVRLFRVFIVLA
jgi:hypothetical protein